VLEVVNLSKHYAVQRSLGQILRGQPPQQVRAVDGINLQTRQAKTLGLVGESGSGKTTLARCVMGLVERSGGEISLLICLWPPTLRSAMMRFCGQLQIVFQSPDEALNPYLTIAEALRRPLLRLVGYSQAEADADVANLLAAVKLSPTYAERSTHSLSGGEKQRIAMARAFAL